MVQSREVCYCTADVWTRVIAWLQIIVSTMVTLYWSISFICILSSGAPGGLIFNVRFSNVYWEIVVMILFILVFGISGLVMGNLLLKGANERNSIYLKAWIIYTIIWLIFITLKYVKFIMATFSLPIIILWVTLAIFEVIIAIFLLWVVSIFEKEVEAEELRAQDSYKV